MFTSKKASDAVNGNNGFGLGLGGNNSMAYLTPSSPIDTWEEYNEDRNLKGWGVTIKIGSKSSSNDSSPLHSRAGAVIPMMSVSEDNEME